MSMKERQELDSLLELMKDALERSCLRQIRELDCDIPPNCDIPQECDIPLDTISCPEYNEAV